VLNMATADLKDLKIRLVYDNGVDEDGKPAFQYKTYSNTNLNATPDAIYQSAHQLGSLSSKTLINVEKNESYDINA
jgi:hypothetical protein